MRYLLRILTLATTMFYGCSGAPAVPPSCDIEALDVSVTGVLSRPGGTESLALSAPIDTLLIGSANFEYLASVIASGMATGRRGPQAPFW
jgi:hypothetical protein